MNWKNVVGWAAAPFTGGASLLMTDTAHSMWNDFTGKTARDETNALNALQQRNYETQIQQRVADGLKAGINPLAAIGASTNYQPYFQSSSGGSGNLNGLMDLFGRFKGLLSNKFNDDLEYEREARNLDLEGKRLENRILRNRAQESEQNLKTMSDTGSAKEVPNMSEQPNRSGETPLFRVAYDLQGRPRLVANQDVMEMDSDNAGYLASIKHAISQGFVDKISGRVNSEQYRMMLDDMYYNMYGRHISNLDDLYFSPAEAAIAAAGLYGQVKGSR